MLAGAVNKEVVDWDGEGVEEMAELVEPEKIAVGES
jgi:hypothetical protein